MVMDLLGPNLESLFDYCERSFSPKTVLMLAEQMITRIEAVHVKNYLHRDIKPDNFLIGLGEESNIIYILDFGLAKRFRDSKTHQHIPYMENKMLIGTVRYASINNHLGIEQSRKDDLEALGYVLAYLARGELPWQSIKGKTKEKKHERILAKKMGIPVEYTCEQIFPEFATYLRYCKGLKFEDRPDYDFLRQLFTSRMKEEFMNFDLLYDWISIEPKALNYSAKGTLGKKDETKKHLHNQSDKEEQNNRDDSNKSNEEVLNEEEQKLKEEMGKELFNEERKDNSADDEAKKKIDEIFKKLTKLHTLTQPQIPSPAVKDSLMEICKL